MNTPKKTYILQAISFTLLFIFCNPLFSGDNDANSGGDAANDLGSGSGIAVNVYTLYTGDLGPGDCTDSYRITNMPLKAGDALSVTFTTTNTVNDFDVCIWTKFNGSPTSIDVNDTHYSYYIPKNNLVSVSYSAIVATNYDFNIRIFLNGSKDDGSTKCHYSFYITTSTQQEGLLGGDAGNNKYNASLVYSSAPINGYLDQGDTEDYYKISASADSFVKMRLNTSSTLDVNTYIIYSTTEKGSKNIPASSSGELSVLNETITRDYYIRISRNSGYGTYTLSAYTDMDYLCVVNYPNPFDISKNHKKITFSGSGVPRGKIRIYTFDGKLIKTLEETAGNNKIEWYPLQDNVPSGIYYFSTENSEEKNIGKITIIR